jgi:hypothetical protein
MGTEYTFYDYVDADNSKVNIINDWLNGEGKVTKAYFNSMISNLGASPPPGSHDSVWRKPYTWPLHGKWKDFFEIRKKVKGVQYRLIAKVENRNVFLITWGYHKGSWETDITPETGKERVNQMINNPTKYRRKHDRI